jgi:hypothetical protein
MVISTRQHFLVVIESLHGLRERVKNRLWISNVSVLLYTGVTKLTILLDSFLDVLITGMQHIVTTTRINAMAKKVEMVLTILELKGVSPKLQAGVPSLFLFSVMILTIT